MATLKRMLERLWQPLYSDQDPSKAISSPEIVAEQEYHDRVESLREQEYPALSGTTYLDHAGTTPYAKSAIESWTSELTSNLFGNPHSASASSQLSTRRIDDIRLKVLRFLNASPKDFDVVFVANTTAAIRLVAEAFRDHEEGFWHGYHADSHTSLVGCRELATQGSKCFDDDESLDTWIRNVREAQHPTGALSLVAYPGQSNMTGRRLPLRWTGEIRSAAHESGARLYTLLDAASLASTYPLDLSDAATAPDFLALSFYKIFGFPDLGALLVRKESANVLLQKKYFAGGTVDAVVNSQDGWHAKKTAVHSALEEGTLPFHNIIALDHALSAHARLFGSMREVSRHTALLRDKARKYLINARHASGGLVCMVYEETWKNDYGPVLAFNLRDSTGGYIATSEVEKLCVVKGIQLRTGGLCNPGGIARYLNLSDEQIRASYDSGHRCGGENDLIDGKPTGAIRISFGASSTMSDLESFVGVIEEYYVQRNVFEALPSSTRHSADFFIEALSVFPIKSCAAYEVPADQRWVVTTNGLEWDREWCLVHEGTNVALNQKKYPRMALLQPRLDLRLRKLTVSCQIATGLQQHVEISLDDMSEGSVLLGRTCSKDVFTTRASQVCGDIVPLHVYTSNTINDFFSNILDVPCCLARYSSNVQVRQVQMRRPPFRPSPTRASTISPQLRLANESPILIVSRSSIDELNQQISKNAHVKGLKEVGKISARSFRANIVVAESTRSLNERTPYIEDDWTSISIHKSPSGSFDKSNHVRSVRGLPSNSSEPHSDSLDNSLSSHSTPRSVDDNAGTGSFQHASHNSSMTSLSDPAQDDLIRASSNLPSVLSLDILGPCQRCQMVSIDQSTAKSQHEPFSTLVRTRRKGDGRVWFGVHAALNQAEDRDETHIQVGDLISPHSKDSVEDA